ncbi:Pentatricopeptide repeat-containing protein [Nymphaea thermarum]|nr:Pentatricopeptide repeat-containing protein [Nymphaea thermarum]
MVWFSRGICGRKEKEKAGKCGMMLRPKQVAPICKCARSFILASSRSNNQDGSASSCSDEEKCTSEKHSKKSHAYFSRDFSTLISSTKVASPTRPRVVSGNGTTKRDAHPAPLPHADPISGSELDKSLVSHGKAQDYGQDENHSQTLFTEQIIKAGVATVGFISDIVQYFPTSNINAINVIPQNFMVDPGKSSGKLSKSKTTKIANPAQGHDKSSIDEGPKTTVYAHHDCSKPATPHSRKGSQNLEANSAKAHSEIPGPSSSYPQYERKCIPQGSKSYLDRRQGNPKFFSGKEKIPQKRETGKLQGTASVDNFCRNPLASKRTSMGPASWARQGSCLNDAAKEAGGTVYNTLRHLKWWGPAAESALRNLNCKMNAYQANQLLKLLKDHSVALGFFYWLKRQPGYKHDSHCYTTMIGILGNARQFAMTTRLLDEMVRDGCQPNVVTYNRLIHSYGRAGLLPEAVNLFYKMQKAGCEPDRVTYCTLIDIHAKSGLFDVAMDMYHRMIEVGLTPDTFTYGVIINCLGKAGHLVPAYRLFCEMVASGCVPNIITYNIMITLHAKARNFSTALELYQDMQNAGFHPDNVTYNIIMEVLGHSGHLDEAEAVFEQMKRQNLVPDEPVYGLLIDMWGKAGNILKAQRWYQSMLDAGLKPNVPTCNSLLSAFLRLHLFADAYKVLQSMMSLGLNPSSQTYTLLLSCCTADTSSREVMFSCHELMSVTGHPAHSFLSTMPSAGPDGQNVRDHATKFLDLMHKEDRESKRGLVDAVIDFLHKFDLKEEAGSVWDVASLNVYPHAVTEKQQSYWLINLHFMSNGTAVVAVSRTLAWFRKQMLACGGVSPDRIDIVTGWGRRSRVTGTSLVRQSVYDLLQIFGFPFVAENGNCGCFVGFGDKPKRPMPYAASL